MNKVKAGLMAWVVMALTSVPVAQAAQFHVATAQEFQTALSTAAANGEDDTIFLAAGIYYGNFNFLTSASQALTIQPETGLKTGDVILDGQTKGRVLKLDAGSMNANVTISNLVFRNGSAAGNGGGLYAGTHGVVTVSQCQSVSNRVTGSNTYGGGICVANAASSTVQYNTIEGNSDAGYGGGVAFQNVGSVNLSDNAISANNSVFGGGVYIVGATTASLVANRIRLNSTSQAGGGCYVSGGTVSFSKNFVQSNASGLGGGIAVQNATTVTIVRNRIESNTSHSYDYSGYGGYRNGNGGGIYIIGGAVSVSGNAILYNGAGGGAYNLFGVGGGFYLQLGNALATCDDNVFVGNEATYSGAQGAGLYCSLNGNTNTCLRFVNNTLYANANAAGNGGGAYFTIANSTEKLQVYNNTIWGNTAANGKDIYLTGYGSEKKMHNNNFHDMSGLWDFASGNIDVDPLFTDTPNGDYHLRANSLCINAGNNSASGLSTVDKDGNVRVGDGTVDIGAYEQCATDRHPADTDANWVIDAGEFSAYATAWTNRAAWPSGPTPVVMDYVTRAGYLLENGGTYHNEGGGKPRNWKPGP